MELIQAITRPDEIDWIVLSSIYLSLDMSLFLDIFDGWIEVEDKVDNSDR